MFSHVMVGVSDIEASKNFYDAIFATLGLGPGVDNKGRYFYISPAGVFAITGPVVNVTATAKKRAPTALHTSSARAPGRAQRASTSLA